MREAVRLAVLLLLLTAGALHAQDQAGGEAAALLRAQYFGIELQRVATEQVFTIRPGSEFPVGTGDRIRTGLYGRVDLDWTLDGRSFLIVLPGTDLTVAAMRAGGDGLEAVLQLDEGRLVARIDPEMFASFTIATPNGQIRAAGEFAVQHTGGRTIAVVTSGTLVYAARAGASGTIAAGTSLLLDPDRVREVPAPAVPTFTQVEAEQVGCPGIVASRGGLNLNVRLGPAFGYTELGTIPNGNAVRVVGISPDGQRFRIAYRSSYGWVIAEGVQTDCDRSALPVFPFSHAEVVYPAIDATGEELDLLRPFFGPPEDAPWFYR